MSLREEGGGVLNTFGSRYSSAAKDRLESGVGTSSGILWTNQLKRLPVNFDLRELCKEENQLFS